MPRRAKQSQTNKDNGVRAVCFITNVAVVVLIKIEHGPKVCRRATGTTELT